MFIETRRSYPTRINTQSCTIHRLILLAQHSQKKKKQNQLKSHAACRVNHSLWWTKNVEILLEKKRAQKGTKISGERFLPQITVYFFFLTLRHVSGIDLTRVLKCLKK